MYIVIEILRLPFPFRCRTWRCLLSAGSSELRKGCLRVTEDVFRINIRSKDFYSLFGSHWAWDNLPLYVRMKLDSPITACAEKRLGVYRWTMGDWQTRNIFQDAVAFVTVRRYQVCVICERRDIGQNDCKGRFWWCISMIRDFKPTFTLLWVLNRQVSDQRGSHAGVMIIVESCTNHYRYDFWI